MYYVCVCVYSIDKIIDTNIQTNYTNDAYICDTHLSLVLPQLQHRPLPPVLLLPHLSSSSSIYIINSSGICISILLSISISTIITIIYYNMSTLVPPSQYHSLPSSAAPSATTIRCVSPHPLWPIERV
jgi:hypothetical protein